MNIKCTKCQASYILSSMLLGAEGRKVKCVKCQNIWHVKPKIEDLNQAQKIENNKQIVSQDKVSLPAIIGPRITIYHYLVPVILLFCVIVVSGIVFYGKMSHRPAIAAVYRYFGITEERNVVFDQVSMNKAKGEVGINLYIQGYVVNIGKKDVKLPYIRFLVYDNSKSEIFSHIHSDKVILKPNESYKIENTLRRLTGKEGYVVLDIGDEFSFFTRSGL